MARPTDLKYSESHEWIRHAKGDAEIGITDYAVKQLNDLVHIELPKTGDAVTAGQPFGEIESVKTVSDLVSPITGKITAVNTKVADNLEILAKSPYGDGWLIKVKPGETKELSSLMSAAEYDAFIKSEGHGHDDGDDGDDGDDED